MRPPARRPRIVLAVAVASLFVAFPLLSADAQWVFVARKALGRVEQLTKKPAPGNPGYDIATVVLDAPAARVYATASGIVHKNQALRISYEDPARYRIDVAEGDRTASLSVSPLGDKVSQLMIVGTAGPGEDSTTSRAVSAVMRVCQQLRRHCTPSTR